MGYFWNAEPAKLGMRCGQLTGMGGGDPIFCVATGLPSGLRLASLQRPPRSGAGLESRVYPGSQHRPLPLNF